MHERHCRCIGPIDYVTGLFAAVGLEAARTRAVAEFTTALLSQRVSDILHGLREGDLRSIGEASAGGQREADAEEEKQKHGEYFFAYVSQRVPEIAAKITGMLLELDEWEQEQMMTDAQALERRLDDAIFTLVEAEKRAEDTATDTAVPPHSGIEPTAASMVMASTMTTTMVTTTITATPAMMTTSPTATPMPTSTTMDVAVERMRDPYTGDEQSVEEGDLSEITVVQPATKKRVPTLAECTEETPAVAALPVPPLLGSASGFLPKQHGIALLEFSEQSALWRCPRCGRTDPNVRSISVHFSKNHCSRTTSTAHMVVKTEGEEGDLPTKYRSQSPSAPASQVEQTQYRSESPMVSPETIDPVLEVSGLDDRDWDEPSAEEQQQALS